MKLAEIKNANADQVEARMAEIKTEMEQPEASPDELLEEARALNARAEELRAKEVKREELRGLVAGGAGHTVRKLPGENAKGKEDRTYDAASPEYRTAWLKRMATGSRGAIFGELNEEERRAWTFTTANTPSVVPKVILDRIVELVRSQYPMYMDATKSRIKEGFGVPRHKSIDAGDAEKTNEGAANTDEQDTFDLLEISNEEIKKSIEMSYKMKFASIDAFEDWIVSHLAKRIAVAKEKYIIAQLDNVTYGIDSANAAMTGKLTDKEMRKIFAAINQDGQKVVYANSKTIWEVIADLEDAQGRKLFVPSTMEDALTQGRVYGAPVKEDANIMDNVLYVGVPASILANEASEYEIFQTLEAKTAKTIHTAISLFGAGLENPKAFVKYTHTPGGV